MSPEPSPRTRRFVAIAAAPLLAVTLTTVALACGPFFTSLLTVSLPAPAAGEAYARGDLGVVKPTFARRYLVQAYRALSGVAPAGLPAPEPAPSPRAAPAPPPLDRWRSLQQQVLSGLAARPAPPRIDPMRRLKDYTSFDNCLDVAFENAADTLTARITRYGARGREVDDWLTGQIAVFRNCDSETLVLPAAAPPWADEALQADRDYQIAAAYFYAAQYEEAAWRFRAVAADGGSPWRSHGRYLAARAWIRLATVPVDAKARARERLATAEEDLRATLADKEAARFHRSARGLLDFIAARVRPLDRLHELSRRIATAPSVTGQDLVDYTWLMDQALGESVNAGTPVARADLIRDDDLTDWIVAVQRGGGRAVDRWRQTRSELWLVAALWTVGSGDDAAPALIDAAAGVPRDSRAFPTASFLRVRLLIQRGELDRARLALAALPLEASAGLDAETLNLFRAERFAVAGTLDELLANAPRSIVAQSLADGPPGASRPLDVDTPVWDDDVAAVFNTRLPLARLAEAAESTRLPARLRLRVAQAAFSRAALLQRADAGQRAARVLRQLAPSVRADLDRYLAAPADADRHRAAVLLLLRTPGLSINVHGMDDDDSYARVEPARRFGHGFPTNWWCGVTEQAAPAAAGLIHGAQPVPFPAFVTDVERAAAAAEVSALRAAGEPRAYLTSAALAWAAERRSDPEAAEALALAIEGWRWSPCAYGTKSDLPRRAFAALHRLFPGSPWAQRTKYWYD